MALFGLVVIRGRQLLGPQLFAAGDSAANAILVDEALRGELFVGYYSRFGFNHPGPAFLYVEALGTLVFHRLTGLAGSDLAGSALGVALLNSLLIAWIATIAHRRTRSAPSAALLVLLILLLGVWVPGLLTLAWAPALIIVPFILLMVSGGFLAAGHTGELLPFSVACGLLIHGHLSSLIFVSTSVLVVGASWLLRRRRDETEVYLPTRSEWVPSVAVILLFLTPLVIHLVIDWPGELGAYVHYVRSNASRTGGSLSEALRFAADSLSGGLWHSAVIVVTAATAVVYLLVIPTSTSWIRGFRCLLVMVAMQTIAFLVYSWRTVDDLALTYLGWFGLALPTVSVWVGMTVVLLRARSSSDRRVKVASDVAWMLSLALVGVIILDHGQLITGERGSQVVGDMVQAIGDEPSVLAFDHDQWPIGVGVLAEVQRSGGDVCVADPAWESLVTERLVCRSPGTRKRLAIATTESGAPTDPQHELLRSDGFVLLRTS